MTRPYAKRRYLRDPEGRCSKHPNGTLYTKSQNPKGRCKECMLEYQTARYAESGLTNERRFMYTRSQAKRRGFIWELSYEQWLVLVSLPCVYSLEPNANIRRGLDQRIAGAGYTLDNSQPCCSKHNFFKSDILTHEQTMDIIHQYHIPCGNKNWREIPCTEGSECGKVGQVTLRREG
jgi:hypothetical protein